MIIAVQAATYDALRGTARKCKGSEQPCRIFQVVELGRDSRMCCKNKGCIRIGDQVPNDQDRHNPEDESL